MKKVFLKIIKEDSTKKDPLQKKKDSLSKVLVAGDSIAVGMSINGLGLPGAKTNSKLPYPDLVPAYPAVRGAMASGWIKKQLLRQLNLKDSFLGHKLIIIAGTNDSLNYALSPSSTAISNALSNINSMVDAAISKGIKKEDIAVMRIAKYEPSESNLKSFISNRQNRKWYPKEKTGEDFKEAQATFVEKFNAGISGGSYKTFDMVPVSSDGVHTGSSGYKQLLKKALQALNIKNIKNVEIPAPNSPVSTALGKNIKSSTDCHVNANCNCVDRSVSGEITILGVQRALKILNPNLSLEENGDCNKKTREAIMSFQKQQQEKDPPFQPPDGREFLRCDACVGTNTMAAINQELSPQKKTLQGMLTGDELIKVKKRRVRILKPMSGSGKTLEDVKKDAVEIGCHTDLIVLATVLHSESTWYGRWSDEGYAVFNTIINRIQANGPGKGPHFWGPEWKARYKAWNVCLNTSPIMRGQSGANPPFSSKNYPSNLSASVEKVKDFVKKRLSEGSNVGSATFFVHTNAQQSFYNLTQKRMQEFGSKQKALEKAISEHAKAGIKWQGSIETKWPKVKPYPNPRNKKKTTTRHPLMFRWRGFGYGKSAQQIRDSWTRDNGAAPEITVGGSSSSEIQKNKRKLKKSSIEVFGNREKRKNWSRKAFSDEEINNYLRELLREKEQEFTNV